jgi:hypothetical protein
VGVVSVNLRRSVRLAVALAALAIASPAHAAAPVSAHAMVHTCCTDTAELERVFKEADALGSAYIRVDVELNSSDWSGLDQVMELSRRHHLPVLGILLAPPASADAAEFGTLAGRVAEHAAGTINHWEILNEPDADWAFDGTAEDYARILSAAHDAIKARAPGAQVVFGGLLQPNDPAWLERVFATPGTDALHKFDIANIHLRGPVDLVVNRYRQFGAWLRARGFDGPLWVTEHGYPADPNFQTDPAYRGGDDAQAAYLTQSLVGLGEAHADQVFVTLRDNAELLPVNATEGIVGRPAFAAVRRVVESWDQLMAWRREQRENEFATQYYLAAAASSTAEARAARPPYREARLRVHAAQDALSAPHAASKPSADARRRDARRLRRLTRRLEQARALLAGRHTALLWHTAVARWRRGQADERALTAFALKQRIAGG